MSSLVKPKVSAGSPPLASFGRSISNVWMKTSSVLCMTVSFGFTAGAPQIIACPREKVPTIVSPDTCRLRQYHTSEQEQKDKDQIIIIKCTVRSMLIQNNDGRTSAAVIHASGSNCWADNLSRGTIAASCHFFYWKMIGQFLLRASRALWSNSTGEPVFMMKAMAKAKAKANLL